jgi:hypothetical protein
MAYPERPSDSNRDEGGEAAAKDLSAEDFERLATIFRPSWKLDDAPFTAGAALSQDEVQALQTSAPHHQVREAAAPNGTHSVASDPFALEQAAFAASAVSRSSAPPSIPLDTVPVAPARPSPPPAPPAAPVVPAAQRPTVPSWTAEADRSPFSPPALLPAEPWARPTSAVARTRILRRGGTSRKPIWIGVAAVIVVAGAGLWLWAANSERTAEAPAPPATSAANVDRAPVPSESVAPVVSAAATTAPPPPPAEEPPPPPPPPPIVEPPQHQAAPPPETPVPKPAPAPKPVAAPGLPPAVAAPPAARPAPKPKPAPTTIVHDVPF